MCKSLYRRDNRAPLAPYVAQSLLPLRGFLMTKFVRLGCALLAGFFASASIWAANLTPVDAGGGALSPPIAHDGYLYVGTGATLSVWNMTDPQNPVYEGRSANAPAAGPIRALTMV